MTRLPRAGSESIVVLDLEKEVLIYDLQINKAFCLNETSAIVYKACDGVGSFEELKRKHKFTEDLIRLALDELRENKLLADSQELTPHFGALSRREAIRRVGLASMIALPVLTSLVAPIAAQAQSAGACQGLADARNFSNFGPGNCCPGLRCLSSFPPVVSCESCIPSGGAFSTCATPAACAACNTLLIKNSCCNGGASTTNGSECLCP